MDGYYNDDTTSACLPCHSTCKMCTGPLETECVDCVGTTLRALEINKCVCVNDNGFYEATPFNIKCGECKSH